MEVEIVTSATQAPSKHSLPEIEIYCYLLLLIYLIDQKKYNEVCDELMIIKLPEMFVYVRCADACLPVGKFCFTIRLRLVLQLVLRA